MTKDNIHQYWPFLEAIRDGKILEHRPGAGEWVRLTNPEFSDPPEHYRVVVEPKELWAVYQGNVLQVIRETKEDAENWSSSETKYTIVKMREVREDTTV